MRTQDLWGPGPYRGERGGGGGGGLPSEPTVISGELSSLPSGTLGTRSSWTQIWGDDFAYLDASYNRIELEAHDWTNQMYRWDTPGVVTSVIDSYEYRVNKACCMSDGHSNIGMIFCFQDEDNYYDCRWTGSDSPSAGLRIAKWVAGVETSMVTSTPAVHSDNFYDIGIVFNPTTGLITMRDKPEDEAWGGANTRTLSWTDDTFTSGWLALYLGNHGSKYIYDQRLEYYT